MLARGKIVGCILIFLSSFVQNGYGQLRANFSTSVVEGCTPLIVSFSDESTGNPTSWYWDLGNGTISYLQNPSTTYFNPGQYTIKLVVKNGGVSDSAIKYQHILVSGKPFVDFSTSGTSGCYPVSVTFSDLSIANSGTLNFWQWDFGDGHTSNLQNPSHTYLQSGNFTVSLQVANTNGCSALLSRPTAVQIGNGVTAGFTNGITNSCSVPAAISFVNTSTGTGMLSYKWYFGDGDSSTSANPSHTYQSSGSFTVKLVVTNNSGCMDSIVKPNAIVLGNIRSAFSSKDTACVNANVIFTNNSVPAPVSVLWRFGDGQSFVGLNAEHRYLTGGNYIVKMISDYGACKDSIQKIVRVFNNPVARFSSIDTASCKTPLIVRFQNQSTGATGYWWKFGDNTTSNSTAPNHTYNSLGSYEVTLITSNAFGCADTLIKTDFVQILKPVISAENLADSGCAPLTKTFIPTITSADPIVNYTWNFGDGTTSNLPQPTHSFPLTGVYPLKLVITTATGCKDSIQIARGIVVGSKPAIRIDRSRRWSCAKSAVVFRDTTLGANSWLWDFGDGYTSAQQQTTHIFIDTGYFNIKLVVGINGCRDSVQLDSLLYIKPPIGKYQVTFVCNQPLDRNFTDLSTNADKWYWNFGDGDTSTLRNPVHTYATPGIYNTSLRVVNTASGCDYIASKQIQVIDIVPNFSAANPAPCKKDSVLFSTGLSMTEVSNIFWDFGDGGTTTKYSNTASYLYNQNGLYPVKIIVTDFLGCKDTLEKTNYIRVDGPTARFKAIVPGVCISTPALFIDSSFSDGVHPITTWIWNYADGKIDTLSNPPFQHVYNQTGQFLVTLKLVDTKGCTDLYTLPSPFIVAKPVVKFSVSDSATCPSRSISFTNQSTGLGLSFKWDFGDGLTSLGTHSVHRFLNDGIYTVKLVAVDRFGCSDSIIKTNFIRVVTPKAKFIVSDSLATCPPLMVQFTNQSTGTVSRLWDFGDSTYSTAEHPSHFYTVAGTYTVKLTITGPGGCTNVATKRIVIRGPKGTFSYNPLTGCNPMQINFLSNSSDKSYIIWDFNDGTLVNSTDSTITHLYTNTGNFLPKMILMDSAGCRVPVINNDTIVVYGNDAKFGFDTRIFCNRAQIQFYDSSVINESNPLYIWDFGDGTTSNSRNPLHQYTDTGHFYPKLIIRSAGGCVDTAYATTAIYIRPNPTVTIAAPSNGCAPLTVQYQANVSFGAPGDYNWSWSFSNGQIASNAQPSILFNQAGNYTANLSISNANGCIATAQTNVTAYASPIVSAGSDLTICGSATLSASGANTYSWSPANFLSCVNCANPTTTTPVATQYIVSGTNAQGCVSSDTIAINVRPPIRLTITDSQFICKGQSAILQVKGAHRYQWLPVSGISNLADSNQIVQPTQTTTYQVIGFDAFNCYTDTGYVTVVVHALPAVNAGPDQLICANAGTSLQATGAVSYSWSSVNSLSCTQCANPSITASQDAVYMVVGTDLNGCVNYDTVLVSIKPMQHLTTSLNDTICLGESITLRAQGMNRYSWVGDGIVNLQDSVQLVQPQQSSIYRVIGYDSTNCSIDTGYIQITVRTLPNTNAGADQTVCYQSSVSLQASGAASYMWNPAVGLSCSNCANPTLTVNQPLQLVVVGTDNFGCSRADTLQINISTIPQLIVSANDTICLGDSAMLQAQGMYHYTWTGNGIIHTNDSVQTIQPTLNETYRVIGTDQSNCYQDTGYITIVVHSLPNVNAGLDQLVCVNAPTQLQASGAQNYNWSPATNLSCNTCANPVAITDHDLQLIVQGTDQNGCSNLDTISIRLRASFTLQVTDSQFICQGQSANLQVRGAHHYQWLPVAGISNLADSNQIVKPTQTTTYQVIGFDAFNCYTDTGYITVVVHALPAVNAGPDQMICANAGTTLQATGAVSYNWSSVNSLSCTQCANPSITASQDAAYMVVGTDLNGCVNYDTVLVSIKPMQHLTTSLNDSICSSETITLFARGMDQYVWTPTTAFINATDSIQVLQPNQTTTFRVVGSDFQHCFVDTAFIKVVVFNPPTVYAGADQIICDNNRVQLQATGAVSYSWSPATGLSCSQCANPIVLAGSSMQFVVEGTNEYGCSIIDTVQIRIYPPQNLRLSNNDSICIGEAATLNVSGMNHYRWSLPITAAQANDSIIVVRPTQTTTYQVIGNDSLHCNVDTGYITIVVSTPPVVQAGADQLICDSNNQLQASGANTYLWSPGANLSCTTCANPIASVQQNTQYIVKGYNEQGCFGYDTLNLVLPPSFILRATANPTICVGQQTTLQATGAFHYTWSPIELGANTHAATQQVQPTQTTIYQVAATDSMHCYKDTVQITVTVRPLPAINAGADLVKCKDDITLIATGGQSYVWSPADYLTCTACPAPISNTTSNITYSVTGFDSFGCAATDSVNIVVRPKINVTASNDQAICAGERATISVIGASQYQWVAANGLANQVDPVQIVQPTVTTTYQVRGVDAYNCYADTAFITITVHPVPTVELGENQTVQAGQTVTIIPAISQDVNSWHWHSQDGTINSSADTLQIKPLQTTQLQLDVRNRFGCEAQDQITVVILCNAASNLFVPNTFTPDGNGSNDVFYPRGKGLVRVRHMRIFNRWGNVVFEKAGFLANDAGAGWDGTMRGTKLNADVYVYALEVVCDSGAILVVQGNVTLIR